MYEVFKATVPSREYAVKCKYPFPQMKVGQAFTVPADDYAAERYDNGGCAIMSAAHGYGLRHDMKFSTRRNTDDSITVYRVE